MPTPFSVLVADLTYQYDSASLISTASMAASMTATAIDLFHSTAVTGSTVPHNNLTLIQGGSAIERYHMSLSQYTALHEALTVTDSSSVDFTITGQDITAVVLPAGVSHNGLADLATGDVHTQYALLAGRALGQTLIGGTGSGEDLTLQSTAHATKGQIYLGAKFYVDETTGTVNVATNNATGLVFGSLGTANRGLDMSASGLSGSGDYPFYFAANLYWRADGYLYNGSTSATLATQKVTWAGRTTIASTAADAAAIATVEVLHDTAAGLTSGFDRYLLLLRRAQAAYPGNAVAAIASNGALLMGANLDAGIYRGAADQVYLIAGDDLLAQDNDKLILGTGADFEMYHNATNTLFKITTGELQIGDGGSDYTAFENATGFMEFNGAAVAWEYLLPTPLEYGSGLSGISTGVYGTTGFTWPYWADSGAANEQVTCHFQLPRKWKEGSDVYLLLHVVPPVNGVGGDEDVEFEIEYQWVNIDGSYSTTTNTVDTQVFRVGAADANKHLVWTWDIISGTGKTISSDLMVIVKRLTKVGDRVNDNYTDSVWLRYIDVLFQVDTHGSRTQTSK